MLLSSSDLYRFDDFELNRSQRSLTRGGTRVLLSPKAFEVLTHLVLNPRRVVTKEELLQAVWPDSFVEESNLAQQISSLRKTLGDKAGYIVTVPGRGYQFAATVTEETTERVYQQEQAEHLVIQRVHERTHIVIEEAAARAASPGHAASRPRNLLPWAGWGVAAAVLLAVGGNYAWKVLTPPPQLHRVMVADFLNLTGDPSVDKTLGSALNIGLAQSPFVQLMGAGLEHQELIRMQKPVDTPLLGETALEVCRRGDYQALLRGKVQASGIHYTLTLDILNCASGRILATLTGTNVGKDSMLDNLDRLASRARKKLGESNQSLDQYKVPIIDASTFSFEALNDFNLGSELGNQGKLLECIPYFQKAIELDPKFAMAQASLGIAFYSLGSVEKSAQYFRKALELSSSVTQPEKLFIRSNYDLMAVGDLDASAAVFQEWTRTYPQDETAWVALTNVYVQLGRFPQAIKAGERSMQFDEWRPQVTFQNLADAYKRDNRFADAKRTLAAAQAQDKDSPAFHQLLFDIAIIERDPQAIHREIEWWKGKPELFASLQTQAILAADHGRPQEFEDLFRSAILDASKEVDADLADSMFLDETRIELQLGRTANAARLLQRVRKRSGAEFALLQTRLGRVSAGEAYLRLPEAQPKNTIEHFLLIPELKALVALSRHDPAGAILALKPSQPYELIRGEIIQIRGEAYLAANQGDKAAAEFQKVLANRGIDEVMQPYTLLTHLGLARAYALQNNPAASRSEYERLFLLWKDADPNLPVLRQAHLEYAHLPGGRP